MTDAPIVMDLGDFTPEEYTLKFAIQGRQYEVVYAEATVDEVFRMLAEIPAETPEERMKKRREIVKRFLSAHLKSGDADALAKDLDMVPFERSEAPFDIVRLYASLTSRVKKNDPGESPDLKA